MPPKHVTIVEVGPRDGLQNEQASVSAADKIEFVNRLTAAGLPVIEVSAFVSPKWVPQMADAAEVFAGIASKRGTRYSALVPNLAGLDRAMSSDIPRSARLVTAAPTCGWAQTQHSRHMPNLRSRIANGDELSTRGPASRRSRPRHPHQERERANRASDRRR